MVGRSQRGPEPIRSTGQTNEETVIPAKIFVGNLAYETTQDQLSQLVAEFGAVRDVFLPTDRATGRPRGFAFVEFEDDSAAASAIEKLDGFEHNGRALRVNAAEPRERRPAPFRPPPDDDFDGGGFAKKPKGSRRGLRGRKRRL